MHVISDELYNEILNVEFPPELLKIKNSIISSNNENQGDISNKNSILVRTLSLNEYDKFIINNTCGGSITKNDIDVWHYIKNPVGNSYAATCSSGSPQGLDVSYLTHSVTYLGQIGAQTKNYNYTIIYEICSTNSSNQHTAKNQQQCICDAIVGNHNGIKYVYVQDRQTFQVNYQTNKNIEYQQLIKNVTYGSATIRFTFNVSMMFRPVFQYIDNKKSTNIYS